MTPEQQLIKHNPEQGLWGDCHRTTVASILDLLPQDVPHFCDDPDGPGVDWRRQQTKWLAKRGLAAASVPFIDCPLEDILRTLKVNCAGAPYILGGKSETGCNHSVVVLNGRIQSDPAGTGIIGPCDDGYYWITFITVGACWNGRTEP